MNISKSSLESLVSTATEMTAKNNISNFGGGSYKACRTLQKLAELNASDVVAGSACFSRGRIVCRR
jgi:hypothetical protein